MKRFRFPLQPVAVLRAHREMRAQEAFAAAVQAFSRAELALTVVRERVTQLEATLNAARRSTFSAADQGHALAAYRQECAAEAAAEQTTSAARMTMNQRRAEYLEAHRNVEIVDRLERKAREVHRLACMREEQLAFDEIAGTRRERGRKGVIL